MTRDEVFGKLLAILENAEKNLHQNDNAKRAGDVTPLYFKATENMHYVQRPASAFQWYHDNLVEAYMFAHKSAEEWKNQIQEVITEADADYFTDAEQLGSDYLVHYYTAYGKE